MYNRDARTIVRHECRRGVYEVCVRLMVLEAPRVLRLHCRSSEIVGVQRARRKGFVAVWNTMRALRADASQGECKCFAPREIVLSSIQHVHEAIIDGFVDILARRLGHCERGHGGAFTVIRAAHSVGVPYNASRRRRRARRHARRTAGGARRAAPCAWDLESR